MSLRLILNGLALGWFLSTIACCVNAQPASQAVILQYHHVSTQTPPVTSLGKASFQEHMDYLAEHDFTILPLEQVISSLQTGGALPDKTAVITFDDGYTSVYDTAFPILQARHWPFTVFVTSGLVGSNNQLYATWDQLREMGNNGATLANHTVSHPYLLDRQAGDDTSQWLDGVRQEIQDAEQEIARETGQSHKLLAYPYGEYNAAIQALVKELGFIGIGQHSGPINARSDFTALPRFPFSGIYASMNTFPTKVQSLAFAVSLVQPDDPVTENRSPGAVLSFDDSQPGLSQLGCFNNNEPITVNRTSPGTFEISTHVENKTRRFRYNCTAPGRNGRYYWYSIPWVNPGIRE